MTVPCTAMNVPAWPRSSAEDNPGQLSLRRGHRLKCHAGGKAMAGIGPVGLGRYPWDRLSDITAAGSIGIKCVARTHMAAIVRKQQVLHAADHPIVGIAGR